MSPSVNKPPLPAEAVLHGRSAGDCGRDGCRSRAVVHDAAAALPAPDPKPVGGVAAPVDSMELLWQDWERAAVENRLGAAIVGSDATVKEGLEKLVGDTGANEVIVVTDTYEHEDRLESYRRVAGAASIIEVRPTFAVEA